MSAVTEWMLARAPEPIPARRRIVAGVDMTDAPSPPAWCDRLEEWPAWARRRNQLDDLRDLREQEEVLGHEERKLADGAEPNSATGLHGCDPY